MKTSDKKFMPQAGRIERLETKVRVLNNQVDAFIQQLEYKERLVDQHLKEEIRLKAEVERLKGEYQSAQEWCRGVIKAFGFPEAEPITVVQIEQQLADQRADIERLQAEVERRNKELRDSHLIAQGRLLGWDSERDKVTDLQQKLAEQQAEIEQARTKFRCFHCGKWITEKEAPIHFGEDEGELALCYEWAKLTDQERRERYEDAEQHVRVMQDADAKQQQECDRLRQEVQRLNEPRFGDLDSQARAWVAVSKVLSEVGMESFFSVEDQTGRDRAIAFIRHLAKLAKA